MTDKQKLKSAMVLLGLYEKKVKAYQEHYGLEYPGGPQVFVLERELFALREICK